jgi:SSS family solute:Na+ symporter
LFVGVVIVGIPIAIANGGTYETLTTQLPSGHFEPTAWGIPTMLALAVSLPMSFFVAMDNFTRTFAAKDEASAKHGTLLAAFFLLPLAVGTIWLGLTAALLYPGVENSADILSGLKGLLLVGILAALMSTADICILTAAANGSRDIYQRYVNPEVSPKKLFQISITLAAIVGVAAALMAWQLQDVVEILLIAFTINAASLFIPTIAMVTMQNVNTDAAFWSITLALIVVIAWYVAAAINLGPIFSIDPVWPGLLMSGVSFAAISLIAGTEK